MGYDIECIIDIHNYPGEYFCPVCRTLVYPHEALQSQCTHVFCKPCLSHVANSSRACPYDGYLVTEADSKPLTQSDKAYADNIGKVKVHCLYHRSGCTWEGCLGDSTSHCLNCTFGNSPVICNRCGVQIVHRQVHEHAQTCAGAYQAQQAPDAAALAVPTSSGVTTATGAVSLNQATGQAGAPTSQAQNSLPAPLQPGQDAHQKVNANPQAPTTVQATALTTEQLYQQQYQQYYQQYAGYGYDQYQQAYQQYYPYQQVSVQQYHQQALQVSGQPNVPAYGQVAATQAQVHSSSQTQVQSQALTQHPGQHQAQSYVLVPPAAVQTQTNTQSQVQQHGAAAVNSQLLHSGPPTQYQPPVNPQQPYCMQPNGLVSSQAHHGFPASLPQQHNPITPQPQPQAPQPQPHSVQPQPLVQTQYPQAHPTVHNPQPPHYQMQPQMLSSQSHPQQVQPQLHPQPHLQPSQPNQPTALGGHPNQPTALGGQPNQPTPLGGQSNQPAPVGGQPQLLQASGHAVSGYQSYMQPQPPHQQSLSAHPVGGSLPSSQMQGQLPPQPPLMRPSQAPVPNQPQGPFTQTQVSNAPTVQQHQFHQQNPLLSNSNQQRPAIHSGQHPVQQYVHQPVSSSVQSQLSHQNQHPFQQSQLQSQGAPPHMMLQNTNSHPQLQLNAPMAPGSQFQQPHSYARRPLVPNHGVPFQPQPLAQPSSGFVASAHVKPAQFGSYEHSANQTYSNNTQNQMQTAPQRQAFHPATSSTSGLMVRHDNVSEKGVASKAGIPSDSATETVLKAPLVDSLEARPAKSEVGTTLEQEALRGRTDKSGNSELHTEIANNELPGIKDGFSQHISKLSTEDQSGYSLENNAKLTDVAKQRETLGDTQFEDVESKMSQKTNVSKSGEETFVSTTVPFNQQKSAGVPTFQTTPPLGPPHTQIPGHAANQARTLESGVLPQSRLPINSFDQFQQAALHKPAHDVTHGGIPGSTALFGRGAIPFGAPQGSSFGSVDPHGGVVGRPQKLDGGYMKGPGAPGRGLFGHPSTVEPNALKMNGEPGQDRSAFGSQDQRFKGLPREHLNPFAKNHTLPQDQGSRSFDRGAMHGLSYDAAPKIDSASGVPTSKGGQSSFHPPGPGMFRRDMEHWSSRSPNKDYFGRKAPSFVEASGHKGPVEPQVNPFHDNRHPPFPGYLRRGEQYGPEGLRFGENQVAGHPDHARRPDQFGLEIPPTNFRRGENSPNHFGSFPMGEGQGPAGLSQRPHYGEPFLGNRQRLPRLGEPGFRSNFPLQGFPNEGPYAGDMAHFDSLRKRKYISMGWCRICKVDCETVEGLDMHSQTREHRKMSMDMVMSIKQQNKKKQKFPSDRTGREFGNKKKNNGSEARGKKP